MRSVNEQLLFKVMLRTDGGLKNYILMQIIDDYILRILCMGAFEQPDQCYESNIQLTTLYIVKIIYVRKLEMFA